MKFNLVPKYTDEDIAFYGPDLQPSEDTLKRAVAALERRFKNFHLINFDDLEERGDFVYFAGDILFGDTVMRFVEALAADGVTELCVMAATFDPEEYLWPLFLPCPPSKEVMEKTAADRGNYYWWVLMDPDGRYIYAYIHTEHVFIIGPKGKIEEALPDNFWDEYHEANKFYLDVDENQESTKKMWLELIWAKEAAIKTAEHYKKIGFEPPPATPKETRPFVKPSFDREDPKLIAEIEAGIAAFAEAKGVSEEEVLEGLNKMADALHRKKEEGES